MPVYEYLCEKHGPFEAIRPMSEYAAPCACPVCGADAPRVMLTVPRLGLLDGATRRAHETNERSAHEPRSTRSQDPDSAQRPSAGKRSRTLHRPDGNKSIPSHRPWMISY